jgi:translocation and assembly module TamA
MPESISVFRWNRGAWEVTPSNQVARRASTVWALGLVASGCAIGFPDGRHPVEHVELTGAKALDADDVTDGLANHPPRGIVFKDIAPYDELVLQLDRQRIASYYETNGFFSVRVGEAVVEIANEADPESDVRITYAVEEGPPANVVDAAYTTTSTAVSEDELYAASSILVGERFTYDDYEITKAAFDALLQRRGHPRARIDGRIEVDRDANEVHIRIDVDPGPLVRFDEVTFDRSAIPKSAVKNRIAWKPGEVYDPDALRLTEGRLYTLDLASSVRFTPTYHSDDQRVNIAIGFSETSLNELRLGGGLQFDPQNLSVRGNLSYTRRFFFHPLMSFNAVVRPQVLLPISNEDLGYQIEASARVIRDDFLYPRVRLTTGVTYRLIKYEAFATQGPSAQVILGRAFLDDDRLQASIAFNATYYDVFDFDDIPVDKRAEYGLRDRLTLVSAAPSITYDRRDNPLSPHSGFYLSLPVEAGHLIAADPKDYLKVTPEAQGYLSLGTPRIVLAARLRVGANLLDKPLPITQRYFSGGSDSVRGFGRRRLSPGEPVDGVYYPLGGEAMFVANGELRLELVKVLGQWLGVVGFLDAGDTRNAFADLAFDRPHLATGAGLRYHTPVGPLRFDVGYRLNRFEEGEPDPPTTKDGRIVYHISIGEAF